MVIGQTMHRYLLIQLDSHRDSKIRINMSPDEITAQYGNMIESEIQDETHQILARLFTTIGGIDKISQTGDFRSALDQRAQNISCSVKASTGQLFMLKNSAIFVQKPILLMHHKDISYIEFQRCGQHAGGISKSFDIEVVRKETGPEQFKNIDKLEYPVLIKYFQKSGLKMR